MSAEAVPRLDLAPKRTKPLVLWNPLDYLVLLYWCFFFPQAFRWYEERFGDKRFEHQSGDARVWDAVKNDPIRRNLVLQAVVALILGLGSTAALLQQAGLAIAWSGVAAGVVVGVAGGVVGGMVGGVSVGVSLGVAGGLVGTVSFGVVEDMAVGIAVGVAVGVAGGVAFGVAGGVALGLAEGVAFTVVVSVASGVVFGVAGGMAEGVVFGVALGVALPLSALFFGCRIPDWVLALPSSWLGKDRHFSRMVWLPLAPFRRRLESWLDQDWDAGVANVEELLRYTLQFSIAVEATNRVLSRASSGELLARVAKLADRPFSWNLLRFNSANLGNALWHAAIQGIFFLPGTLRDRWQARYPTDLRFDAPARCACAGFWLWRKGDAAGSAAAFARVRDLPHGAELHNISVAIEKSDGVQILADLVAWQQAWSWLEDVQPQPLRPATIAALRELRAIATEATTAHQAHAPLNRASSLGRAAARLKAFVEADPESRPEPEGSLLTRIAKKWLEIVLEAGGAAGEAVLREPIANPYGGYSGLPARDQLFVGRDDILRNIETLWTTGDVLPTIFLFGHRRMGKTSILRHLEATAPANTLVTYLDMQDTGWVEDTAEFLRDVAEAIHRKTTEAHLAPGEPPSEATYATFDRARRSINKLLDKLDSQLSGRRLILAIDEFELIEEGIQKGRLDPGILRWLRSRVQRHRWLGIIFGGLHTLEEMGGDYQKAFFSQTENLRVTYLTRKDFDRLVTQPHPDFALEYTQDLLDEIYRLTHGQPFLVQRLCWELVTRWNERFLEQGETTPRTLTRGDLEPVLDSDFFKNAEYYFDGVWTNVTPEERQLMTFLATREQAWQKAELAAASLEDLAGVLARLSRHDVTLEADGEVRFASELMRRWVVMRGRGEVG